MWLVTCGVFTGPEYPDIAGRWSYNLSTPSKVSSYCEDSQGTLTLNQTDSTFSGTLSGDPFDCNLGALTLKVEPDSGVVMNGSLSESGAITFNFYLAQLDTPDIQHSWRFTGTVSGNSASGTVALYLELLNDDITLAGNWTMSR